MNNNTNEERGNNDATEHRSINSDVLECLIIKGIYSNLEHFTEKVINTFKDAYFDDPIARELFNIFKAHYHEYQELPSDTEIRGMLIDSSVDDLTTYMDQVNQVKISSVDNLIRQTDLYLKEQALKNALVRGVDYVEINPDRVFELIDEIRCLSIHDKNLLSFSTIGDLQELDIPQRQFYLDKILFEEQIILLVGDAGVGKTLFLMELVNSLTQGRDFLDWKNMTEHPIKCLYFDGEMSIYDVLDRASAFSLHPNVGYYPMRYFQSKNKNEIQGDFSDKRYRKHVEEMLIENEIKIFVSPVQ